MNGNSQVTELPLLQGGSKPLCQPFLEPALFFIQHLDLRLPIQHEHPLKLNNAFLQTWQDRARFIPPLLTGQHRKSSDSIPRRQPNGRLVGDARFSEIFCFETYPFQLRDVAVVLLRQAPRAKSIALQYLDPIWIPVEQTEDLDCLLGMVAKVAQEMARGKIWVAFRLVPGSEPKPSRLGRHYRNEQARTRHLVLMELSLHKGIECCLMLVSHSVTSWCASQPLSQ